MVSTTTALVVGAGPTGMTAAIELRRAGVDVRIIDKSTHLAQWSQALVVQARTLEQFQRYGIAHTAVERGRPVTGARVFSDGRQIVHFTLDEIPSRYPYLLFLPQSETEAILNGYMESLGVRAERGVELTSISPGARGTLATLRHPDGRIEQVDARWLLGCDGAHSTVRGQAGIPFQGEGVDLHFFLGDLEVEGEDAPGDELLIHLHHGNVLFTARLTDKLTRVIVAKHADANSTGKTADDRELSIADFQSAIDDAGVRLRVLRFAWMTPFHVNDRQAAKYRAGNIFLAGDASHIHSPVGGQGMNTGIQDAANLCWKIAAVERGSADPELLLNSYDAERAEVGRALLARTGRGLQLATSANPLLTSLRDLVAPGVTQLEAVQRAVSGFISETAIEYRSSSVVFDGGGEGTLRAGDRLPDLALTDGSTLLAHWTNGRHLAVLLDGNDADAARLAAALPSADVMPVRSANLDNDGRRLLGQQPALFVLRPDGYVGYRGTPDWSGALQLYARQNGLAPLQTAPAAG